MAIEKGNWLNELEIGAMNMQFYNWNLTKWSMERSLLVQMQKANIKMKKEVE